MRTMNLKFTIDAGVTPSFWIWAGKRASGREREPFINPLAAEYLLADILGLQFDPTKCLDYRGLKVTGAIAIEGYAEVLLKIFDADVLVVFCKEDDQVLQGDYSFAGWISKREFMLEGTTSDRLGVDGLRISCEKLHPLGDLIEDAMRGEIEIVTEEEDEDWWDK